MNKQGALHQVSTPVQPLSLIQADDLRALLGGVSDMWLWRRAKAGTFPKPIMLSGRRFWRRDEVYQFIEQESAKRVSPNGDAANG